MPRVTVSDIGQTMAFQMGLQAGEFTDYTRILPATAFAILDDNGQPIGREWEPVGINSAYLKNVGELAKILEAGLPKESRSPKGMLVRAFTGGTSEKGVPLAFDFDSTPGAATCMPPPGLRSKAIAAETAAILAPAIRLTVAALRAHQTRNLAWAEEAATPEA